MASKTSPKVRLRSATSSGGLSTAIIKRTLRRRLAAVKYCYVSMGLPSNPKLTGRVTIAFAINANGKVGNAAVRSSSLGSSAVASCVQRAVRRVPFPKPTSMTLSTATYSFKPR